MNLIIHKHYQNKEQANEDIDINYANEDKTIAYISGSEDIMKVLKELIKTQYVA